MAQDTLGQSSLMLKMTTENRIAFITSYRLGDSLLSMILINNMLRQGWSVEVFSQTVYQLADWFPGVTVFPFSEIKTRAPFYNQIWFERPNRKVERIQPSPAQAVRVLKESPLYRQDVPMSRVFQLISQQELGIKQPILDNGLRRPADLPDEKNPQKIMIHPTSSSRLKTWKLKGFLQVARLLQDQGFQVEFILGPEEKEVTENLREMGMDCFVQANLAAVARQLFQASWFIGNDSGIGQLASNVGAKTITLYPLSRRARRWKPCWGPSLAVCPTLSEKIPEVGRLLLWKHWITPEAVLKTFLLLREEAIPFPERTN